MGPRLYIDCKSVIYGSMCIYTVTKAEVGSLRCGVDVTTCMTYLNENLSLCEIYHYIQWVYVNMNFKKEVKQNQSSFHSSLRFWSIAFPKSFVRTLFCLLTRLICSCSHESPSVSAALSSIWRVQQFCRCSSLLLVLLVPTLQMAFCLSVYHPIILDYQVWSLSQGR